MATAEMEMPREPLASTGRNEMPVVEDPFVNSASDQESHPYPHRYSAFDTQLFSLNASSSPSQAKRAIEAHIAETNRRLEDAGRLGSTLVQQRAELAEKLKEVEKRKDDAELPPELREKLAEIERDYNDVGRETARALLAPRSRVVSSDDRPADASPAVFSTQASSSPSKVSVPSRKQRNQPTSRAGDIQFAADISTSLLVQVRQLQAALAERDESLKTIGFEKSRLEAESEGFSQRLRALDESEQRYKDENWNLETQTHEMIAAAKEAADREKKLGASLAAALAEKTRIQNDLDEIRVAHGKLHEDHTAATKFHDSEFHSLRRNLEVADVERDSLQKKIEELTSQNQELARAIASRSRSQEMDADRDFSLGEEDDSKMTITPEHSPPPSPTKATPRHGALETETLRSSLHHAHRMIQNLKGNIHREKTEKVDLKRMLQDARDELEQRRAEGGGFGSGSKRQKTRPEVFKRPVRPDMLGGSRRARTDIEVDEPDWEDHAADGSPSRAGFLRTPTSNAALVGENTAGISDAYHTANETEGTFETANERETTESEDFQTGAESLAGESTDESTETETGGGVDRKSTVRTSRPSVLGTARGNRHSYISTASTSAGEDEIDTKAPLQTQPLRYRLKMGRVSNTRQPRNGTPRGSLVNPLDSPTGLGMTPPAAEQSLFAELGEFNGGGSEFSTPGRTSVFSTKSTPGAAHMSSRKSLTDSDPAPLPEMTPMIDAGMMTEPWKPEAPSPDRVMPALERGAGAGERSSLPGHDLPPPSPSDFPLPPSHSASPTRSESHYTPLRGFSDSPGRGVPSFITPPKTIWDEVHEQGTAETSEHHISSSPPVPTLNFSQEASQTPEAGSAKQSGLPAVPPMAPFSFSQIITQETIPIEPSTSEMSKEIKSTPESEEQRPSTTQKIAVAASAGAVGILGTMGAALGLGKAKQPETIVAEDETSQREDDLSSKKPAEQKLPFNDISGNAGTTKAKTMEKSFDAPVPIHTSNQGSQTTLTAGQIDNALRKSISQTSQNSSPTQAPVLRPIITGVNARPLSRSRVLITDPDLPPSLSPVKRPGSSNSLQAMNGAQHPPLPPDHRTVIAKAGGRLSSAGPEPSQPATIFGPGSMGPPVAPASAYRRPRTSVDQTIPSPSRGGSTTPRPTQRDRPRTGSQVSRRSSVSSFASEIDQRFNIRTNGVATNQSFEAGPSTDPRMIQAITQTMIGEFLWKYTRKAGRPEMSNTRHRRYFWVHPYTRTLYWSEQDPQAAGGRELKAKSVAIESVRVVSDDNPMPPGLHRKSLEVVTPGRKVKFTAGTANRHETWFNALSYLLMRAADDVPGVAVVGSAMDGAGLTADDVEEFNPGAYGRGSRGNGLGNRASSRLSLSSYNSQGTRGTATTTTTTTTREHTKNCVRYGQVDGAAAAATASVSGTGTASASGSSSAAAATAGDMADDEASRPFRQGSVARFSSMFKPGSVRNSFSVSRRTGRNSDMMAGTVSSMAESGLQPGGGGGGGGGGSIYNASVVSEGGPDSAEELRRELVKQQQREGEGGGKLENVRACCDGKHDVSDLAHGGRHHHGRHSNQSSTGGPPPRSRDRWTASVSSRVRG